MNYILFDGPERDHLLPLTYTRPVADLRIGIQTIREKWEYYLGMTTSTLTQGYLMKKYPVIEMEQNIMINGSFCPTESLVSLIKNLKPKQALLQGENVIALFTEEEKEIPLEEYKQIQVEKVLTHIEYPWHLFQNNSKELKADFKILTEGKTSAPISETNQVLCPENIFIEEGASVEFSILNAKDAPIYIGKNAKILEGCMIRNGLALLENAELKMGAKIYGASTFGPYCKVGGEVNNSILIGYSNKGHDGFLGNAVLGEWCNLGADTNNSNLKNNYAEVKVWNFPKERFLKTGSIFCGLIMGDHSKSGINTMFNTGTVVGVSANVFGADFPKNFVPSFSWGGASKSITFRIDKAFEVAENMMKRRNIILTEDDKAILKHIFESTKQYRRD